MEKDYLELMTQDFFDEASAKQFATMMGKYLPANQIEREGKKVTCHASNKGESWFLVLFSMNVVMQRSGLPFPKEAMAAMRSLAGDFENEEKVNAIAETFEKVSLTQVKIMEGLSKL